MLKYFFILLFFFPLFSYAAVVAKIKGKKCFIYLEDSKAQIGDYFLALDLYGKARGLVRIEKIKNAKAIGTIVEGSAGNNWILEHTTQKTLASNQEESVEEKAKKDVVGILPSFHFNFGQKELDKYSMYDGFGGGLHLFFEKQIVKSASFRSDLGAVYFEISPSSSSDERLSRNYSSSRGGKTKMWYPEIRGTFFFHIPLNNNWQAKLGLGASGSRWFDIDLAGGYSIINENSFTWRHAAHFSFELNFKIPNTPYTMPISLTYSRFQALNDLTKLFLENQQRSRDPVSIDQIIFYVGIAQPF